MHSLAPLSPYRVVPFGYQDFYVRGFCELHQKRSIPTPLLTVPGTKGWINNKMHMFLFS